MSMFTNVALMPVALRAWSRTSLVLLVATIPLGACVAADGASSVGEITLPNSHATIQGELKPASVAPGSQALLTLKATPAEGYRIYALGDEGRGGIARPTLIRILDSAGLKLGEPTADRRPKEKPEANPQDGVARYYDAAITWSVPVEIPPDATPGSHLLEGVIAYQICDASSCERPIGVRFAGIVNVAEAGAGGDATATPLTFTPTSYAAADPTKEIPTSAAPIAAAGGSLFGGLKPRERNSATDQDSSLLLILAAALL
ncbi:MAG: hypothetical protein JNG90_05995, partial [Planctomycetaceae bacterium]|nr:hypothetical protein [Planctomycetaceae bacterium]